MPLPPDPYAALDVPTDADPESIKKSYRKLVLKCHPDRIKDPALVEEAKNEFQKVQQAYEILSDPGRRQRYDDEVRLTQLRRERMSEPRDAPRTYTRTTYAARPSPAPTQPMPHETPLPREPPRGGPRYAYEDRSPDSYFDIPASNRYEEPVPRGHTRKADSYERKTSTSKPVERKEKPKASGWEKPAAGLSLKHGFMFKEKAANARKRTEEKANQAETRKARDKEERRERSEKSSRYTTRVDDYPESGSSSDEDDRVYTPPRRGVGRERSPVGSKARRQPTPEPPKRRQPSPRPDRRPELRPEARTMYADDMIYDSPDDEKWERHHRDSREYMAAAAKARPPLSRQNSDTHSYWVGADLKDNRRSGSDSDRTKKGSAPKSHRRTAPDDTELRPRPPMPHQSSAPANVRAAARTLEEEPLPKSRQNSYESREYRKDLGDHMPRLHRGVSDPMPPARASSKRDTAPIKGSNLKQAETNHDSGYGSGSSPQTPEMQRDDSPVREARAERPPAQTRTTYRATKDKAADGAHRIKKAVQDEAHKFHEGMRKHHHEEPRSIPRDDEGPPLRKFLSPEDVQPLRSRELEREPEKRERRRSTSRGEEPRSNSSRPRHHERRPSISRAESSSRFDELPRRPKLFAERSPERGQRGDRSYSYTPAANAKFASYRGPSTAKYAAYDDHADGGPHRSRKTSGAHIFSRA